MKPKISSGKWPRALTHLSTPYINEGDEHIVVSEISDEPIDGNRGVRQLYSALIPLCEVDQALQALGGIGWEVESWGPRPIVPSDGGWDGKFWVRGSAGENTQYEPLVHGWLNHNQTVMLPDNAFLMCYGLMPRILNNSCIVWDDPRQPVYDVVEVQPLSSYKAPGTYSRAIVRIDRRYLEDYASLKGCAIVAVFYEKRLSYRDPEVSRELGDLDSVEVKLPGRLLNLQRVKTCHFEGADQLVQIWGCRLILKPSGRPVSEEAEPELKWPDLPQIVTPQRARKLRPLEVVYVTDDVLKEWEGRDEFRVSPMTWNVSYGGWWSTSRSRRFGRSHIAVELKSLYEGTPPYVINHFFLYAVTTAAAERDRSKHGDRHIGKRAEEFIAAFIKLTESLVGLAEELELPITQEELCGLDRGYIDYHGWWTMDELKELGHVIPLRMNQSDFMARCMTLYQLIERLKPGPIKQILRALGLSLDELKRLGNPGAVRLVQILVQHAELARTNGLNLVSEFTSLHASWDNSRISRSLTPIFALIELRNLCGHPQGKDGKEKLHTALRDFGLDDSATRTGWGLALDTVYDNIISSLLSAHELVNETRSNT
jgi:hypothetical protein